MRRIARNGDTEFSNQSILNVIERFVKTVNTMDETILVPCRLMDMKVGDENDPACDHINNKTNHHHHHHHHNNKKTQQTCVKELLNSADLFHIYHMLNGVKDGLQWGQFNDITTTDEQTNQTVEKQSTTTTPTQQQQTSGGVKGHVRRPSTVSVASTNSTTSIISDTESEAGSTNEADSGIEETGQESEYDGQSNTERIANNFRKHLDGLTQSLKQMADVAQYLTYRYQHDIGGPV